MATEHGRWGRSARQSARSPSCLSVGGIGDAIKGVIPGFAGGVDNFRGGLSGVVGERGPELVNLPRGSSVTPGGGMGNTYNFNFPNYVGSQDDLRRMINEARLEFERRGN